MLFMNLCSSRAEDKAKAKGNEIQLMLRLTLTMGLPPRNCFYVTSRFLFHLETTYSDTQSARIKRHILSNMSPLHS